MADLIYVGDAPSGTKTDVRNKRNYVDSVTGVRLTGGAVTDGSNLTFDVAFAGISGGPAYDPVYQPDQCSAAMTTGNLTLRGLDLSGIPDAVTYNPITALMTVAGSLAVSGCAFDATSLADYGGGITAVAVASGDLNVQYTDPQNTAAPMTVALAGAGNQAIVCAGRTGAIAVTGAGLGSLQFLASLPSPCILTFNCPNGTVWSAQDNSQTDLDVLAGNWGNGSSAGGGWKSVRLRAGVTVGTLSNATGESIYDYRTGVQIYDLSSVYITGTLYRMVAGCTPRILSSAFGTDLTIDSSLVPAADAAAGGLLDCTN